MCRGILVTWIVLESSSWSSSRPLRLGQGGDGRSNRPSILTSKMAGANRDEASCFVLMFWTRDGGRMPSGRMILDPLDAALAFMPKGSRNTNRPLKGIGQFALRACGGSPECASQQSPPTSLKV
ncbi:hypothetical protein B0H63DRAFT_245861 [Podospora didyma]|uniref:Uncharacterized protein n=1 Tax=Podospora didyma TaxID=330526 RepID=A0AAE0NCI2_9PEZI|nr:hypothetical protein B0H63DRAFT_245861 [Podospora didyma]